LLHPPPPSARLLARLCLCEQRPRRPPHGPRQRWRQQRQVLRRVRHRPNPLASASLPLCLSASVISHPSHPKPL
ncbi:hypothetical protein LTR28_001232, partial [Elasticomyces elasticus]